MIHRGIEYTLAKAATPGIWKSQFQISDELRTGRIPFLAIRRVEQRIGRELKEVARTKLSGYTENIRSGSAHR